MPGIYIYIVVTWWRLEWKTGGKRDAICGISRKSIAAIYIFHLFQYMGLYTLEMVMGAHTHVRPGVGNFSGRPSKLSKVWFFFFWNSRQLRFLSINCSMGFSHVGNMFIRWRTKNKCYYFCYWILHSIFILISRVIKNA